MNLLRSVFPLALWACISEVRPPHLEIAAASDHARVGDRVPVVASAENARVAWSVSKRPPGSLAGFSAAFAPETLFVADREGEYELTATASNAKRSSRASLTLRVSGDCMPEVEAATFFEGSRVAFPPPNDGCDPSELDLHIDAAPTGSVAMPSADGFLPDLPGEYVISYARRRSPGSQGEWRHVAVTILPCETDIAITFDGGRTLFYGQFTARIDARASSSCLDMVAQVSVTAEPAVGVVAAGTTSGVQSAVASYTLSQAVGLNARATVQLRSGRTLSATKLATFVTSPPAQAADVLWHSVIVQGERASLLWYDANARGVLLAEPDLQTGGWKQTQIDNTLEPTANSDIGANGSAVGTEEGIAAIYRRTLYGVTNLRYSERDTSGVWRYKNGPFSESPLAISPFRLFIDSTGRRHAFYFVSGPALREAHCESGCTSATWVPAAPMLAPAPADLSYDLAETNGTIGIAYVSGSAGDFSVVLAQCNAAGCNEIANPQVVATGLTVAPAAIALAYDSEATPLVAYIESASGADRRLRVRRCKPSCALGVTESPGDDAETLDVKWLPPSASAREPVLAWQSRGPDGLPITTIQERLSGGVYGRSAPIFRDTFYGNLMPTITRLGDGRFAVLNRAQLTFELTELGAP